MLGMCLLLITEYYDFEIISLLQNKPDLDLGICGIGILRGGEFDATVDVAGRWVALTDGEPAKSEFKLESE